MSVRNAISNAAPFGKGMLEQCERSIRVPVLCCIARGGKDREKEEPREKD